MPVPPGTWPDSSTAPPSSVPGMVLVPLDRAWFPAISNAAVPQGIGDPVTGRKGRELDAPDARGDRRRGWPPRGRVDPGVGGAGGSRPHVELRRTRRDR